MIIRRGALSFNDMKEIQNTIGEFLVVIVNSDGTSQTAKTTKELIDSFDIAEGHYMFL